MKLALIWFVLICLATQKSSALFNSTLSKYQHIGECYYYDATENLTFVCVETVRHHNFFTPYIKSICLNQQLNGEHTDGYDKSSIQKIHFLNCERPELPNNLFDMYESVHTLDMSYLGLTLLPVDLFENATDLTKLNMSHNEIREISDLSFFYIVGMSEIDFSFNKIERIADYAFFGVYRLRRLNLSNNQLKTLNYYMFVGQAEDLESIFIENNQLQELKGFTSHLFLKLVGIGSNRFNCSYLNTLFRVWEKNGFNFTRINCSLFNNGIFDSMRIPHRGYTETIVDATTENSMILKESGDTESEEQTFADIDIDPKYANFHKFTLTAVFINSVGLIIIAIVLIMYFLCKRKPNRNTFTGAIYRLNVTELQRVVTYPRRVKFTR